MKVRKQSDLRVSQVKIADEMMKNEGYMIAVAMGAGKTAAALTAARRMLDLFVSNHVLVIAPLLVAEETWPEEIEAWEHIRDTDYEVLTGDAKRRENRAKRLPELSIVNRENIPWLVDFWGEEWPYDVVIIDEMSSFKNPTRRNKPTKKVLEEAMQDILQRQPKGATAKEKEEAVAEGLKKIKGKLTRFGSLCKVRKNIDRVYGMTGTPSPNGLMDIWSQYYLLDQGERLFSSITKFRNRWFEADYMGYKYSLKAGSFDQIIDRVSDITISMRTEDFVDMPDLVYNTIKIHLPSKVMKQYKDFERTLILEEHDIEAVNSGVLTGKLLQLCNGSCYDEDGEVIEIHDLKLDALERVIEEAAGAPVFVAYSYQFDLVKLKKRFPKAEVVGETKNLQKRWNNGEISILLAHPMCLHPDTETLTESRGWVKIIDVDPSERVFDGVEFVDHSGCVFSGHRPVMEKFGITLTPNHKLLIDSQWEEAASVQDTEDTRRKARYTYSGDDGYLSSMLPLWSAEPSPSAERQTQQRAATQTLPSVQTGGVPDIDQQSVLPNMEGDGRADNQKQFSGLSKLRRSWNYLDRRVAGFSQLLQRYVPKLQGRFDHRTGEQRTRLPSGQLPLGDQCRTAIQQTEQPDSQVPWCGDAPSRVLPSDGRVTGRDYPADEQGDDCGRSGAGLPGVELQEEPEVKKTDVYDLVDCGPRNRFVIRNAAGEVFISHNSAGHGLNLQYGGSITVWYGLCWSLEHYQQLNKRLHRPGQENTVFIHHIVAAGTMDERVMAVLPEKQATQDALIEATLWKPE